MHNGINITPDLGKRRRRRRPFIRGPIDLGWILAAMRLSATSACVGMFLWYRKGCTPEPFVRINLRDLPFSRKTLIRAVRLLEQEGLVEVLRQPGRCLQMRPIELAGDENAPGNNSRCSVTSKAAHDQPRRGAS